MTFININLMNHSGYIVRQGLEGGRELKWRNQLQEIIVAQEDDDIGLHLGGDGSVI